MADYIKDLRPPPLRLSYAQDLAALQASTRTAIAHLDSGVHPHAGIGYSGVTPPLNLRIDDGRNVYDPRPGDARPLTDLKRNPGFGADFIEFPDHGVKTLSVILARVPGSLTGVAPGCQVIPYRVANGPLFRANDGAGPIMPGASATEKIGEAIELARARPEVRVMSISMGNPGNLGPLEPVRQALGGEVGMAKSTGRAVDAAYDRGIIMVCAGGQIVNLVVYPARYDRTIAVGGFDKRGALYFHYPAQGYQDPSRIDVWARAERINRASFVIEDDPPTAIFADDPRNTEGKPAGTSYATPQVAAAAALWVEKFHDELEALFGDPAARWKITEAFRVALRSSATPQNAKLQSGQMAAIRVLNIPELLRTPPQAFNGPKPGKAEDSGTF